MILAWDMINKDSYLIKKDWLIDVWLMIRDESLVGLNR